MGHNSFIKGSITHVSLGFSHYLLVRLHLVERGKTSVPGGRGAHLAPISIGGVTRLRLVLFGPTAVQASVERPLCGSTLFQQQQQKKHPIKQRRSELELGVTLEQINLEADGP